MDNKMYESLKRDLAKAVNEKNISKIEEIKRILELSKKPISKSQEEYFSKGLTGYASIDRPWLSFYRPDAEEYVSTFPKDKTIWDVIEEKLKEYYDIPALEYFKKQISSEEFINSVYDWARTLRAMGVEKGEIVPIYGVFNPDICAITFALNMIGATGYFLKLAISPEALAEETKEAKFAIVYDEMWQNVACEFSKEKYKKILVTSFSTNMPSPKKEIVSFISAIKKRKDKSGVPDDKNKYIWTDSVRDIGKYYTGDVKVPFEPNRTSFITSSSGTTIGGIVKGIASTNETNIAQLYMAKASDAIFTEGGRCLNHFPPTASTSLNYLYFAPLYNKQTVIVDPRVSDDAFYEQMTKLKPNVAVATGSVWNVFFNRIEKEMAQGKKFDFSYAESWIVGGEGTDVEKFKKWNSILKKLNCDYQMLNGYGSSEMFAGVTEENKKAFNQYNKDILSVGIPYAGSNAGIFDSNGRELPYNTRGELKLQGPSMMKEYYGKPKLTAETKKDGWIHTGDYAEMDEQGFVYIWGRIKEHVTLKNGEFVYLFDIANAIKQKPYIDDAVVLPISTDQDNTLTAHIVWKKEYIKENMDEYYKDLDDTVKRILPKEIKILGYHTYDTILPISPTTIKKDKNSMSKMTDNFVAVNNGDIKNIQFLLNETGKYEVKDAIIESDKTRVRK